MTSIESAEMITGAANIAVSSTRNFLFEVSVVFMMRILGYNYGVRYSAVHKYNDNFPGCACHWLEIPFTSMSALG